MSRLRAAARSSIGATLLGVLTLLVLTACTGGPVDAEGGPVPGDPPPPAHVVVADAARAVTDAGSARLGIELDGPAGPVLANGPVRFDPFAAEFTVDLGTRGAEVRVLGDEAWLRLGGADRWQPLSPGMVPVGAMTGALDAVAGLRDVTEEPGTSEIDGVPAVRYSGTLDLAAARAEAPGPATATRYDELAGLVSETPRVTAWLGAPDAAEPDRGRLLRLQLEPAGADASAQGIVVDVADPGLPVEVTAP
ncbi:hypothetical protein WIS52_13280 [Pseudonocardia nematodicida]|uniref:LppX_LprAFG lipoprotein n=1 Tax=Pseudonocardia nematodicida TaxID=1206997 RepID=A0ABV1KAE6_9PSEU